MLPLSPHSCVIVDGKALREELLLRTGDTVNTLGLHPILHVVYVGSHPVVDTFVGIKERVGKTHGIDVRVHRLPPGALYNDIEGTIARILEADQGSVIIQLPLPGGLPRDRILSLVPSLRDPDMLSEESINKFVSGMSPILPPVVASIAYIFEHYAVPYRDKKIVIVGEGKLVGKPVSLWLTSQGIHPYFYKKGGDVSLLTSADIIISGAGDPHIIKPDMIQDGVVLIDAGTSDAEGESRGDIDPLCASKASLFSPVPGGVGPLTIAMLFGNVITLLQKSLIGAEPPNNKAQ